MGFEFTIKEVFHRVVRLLGDDVSLFDIWVYEAIDQPGIVIALGFKGPKPGNESIIVTPTDYYTDVFPVLIDNLVRTMKSKRQGLKGD